MLRILNIEWLKIKAYPAFWWVIAIIGCAYPGVSYGAIAFYHKIIQDPKLPGRAIQSTIGNPFSFSEVWHTVAYLSSFFVFFPAIVVIMLITNEYSFKTHRQNIIDGWSRNQFMTAKLLDVALVSILIMVLYIAVCSLIGVQNVQDTHGENTSYFIGYFLLQTFSQLSIAFLIGFLLRKSFIALGVFIFLFLILEPLIAGMLSTKNMIIGHFLPFKISDCMIPPPAFFGKMDPASYKIAMNNTGNHCIYTILFTTFLWLVCFRINARRDF